MNAEKAKEKFPKEAWTVVFLLDGVPPTRVVMLKRAAWKKFAPNFHTGIGGTIENETPLENAFRELAEETSISVETLIEFARCVIDEGDKIVYYYWGIYPGGDLPSCTEGDLVWAATEKMLSKEIIPTTRMMIEEWRDRGFALDRPWTIFVRSVGDDLFERELVRVADGLVG